MAQVIDANSGLIQLGNGQKVTAQQGGWYDAQQYWGGTLSAPGAINSLSNQQGAGQRVSNETIAQTNPDNVAYVQEQQQTYQPSATSQPLPAPTQINGGSVSPTVGSQNGGSAGGAGGGTNGNIAQAPTIDINAITSAAYNTPEMATANKLVSDAQAELVSRQQARDTALQGEADNPFYSQATLVGKQAKINNAFDQDASVIQNKISQAQGQVASLKADAAIKVNAAMGQYNINEQAYKDNLTQFSNLLSSGALDNASGTDIAQLAMTTGIPTSEIQSMVAASQKKNNPIQLVQSQDANGQVMLVGVDSNGRVVSTTTIPGSQVSKPKATGSGVSAADQKASDQQANTNNLITDIKNKVTLQSLVDHYASALSIDDIYRLYNENSPWGKAKTTIAQVKQGIYY